MRFHYPFSIKQLLFLTATLLYSVAFAQNGGGKNSDDYVTSRAVSFTSGSRSQWCSLSWNGVQLKAGMKIKYRLGDPANCISSYLQNTPFINP